MSRSRIDGMPALSLDDRFVGVLAANDRSSLQTEVFKFASYLGFDLFNAMVVVDQPNGGRLFHRVENLSCLFETWKSPDIGKIDPVMQHCKQASVPICWDWRTYVAAGLADKWAVMAQYGLHAGLALANHLPGGRHFFVGVDRDQPLPSCPVERTRLVAELQLFAACAQDVALQVLHEEPSASRHQVLTKRELECLRWTMEGKTAWEVGKILSISEQTAVRHVNSATHKLGCVNKHHAVVKALRLGWIQ